MKACERILPPFVQRDEQQGIEPRVNAAHRVRGMGGGHKGAQPKGEDTRLFLLGSVRVSPLLFRQGMLLGMAESNACPWVLTVNHFRTFWLIPSAVPSSSFQEEVAGWPVAHENARQAP